ncbi:MAG: pseudaminic acid synthase, partial [Nocardioidaceae bacterium]|nr:pseudaminic acid synthase [Nocardioidaceae bacterium]
MSTLDFGKVPLGPDHAPVVVAEMSGNHNGDLGRALEIVDMVADSGAQALKLQTYTADTITIDVDNEHFRVSGEHDLWGGRTLHDLYTEAHTPWDWHEPIFERARDRGLVAFSAPFDPTAVDFLEDLDVPAYKVASAEIVDLPLVRRMAETGKPVVISTGMASMEEIAAAVRAARETGNEDLVVLGCTASYPAPPEESNLRTIPVLGEAFGTHVGLSDHTAGIGVAVAAVALGATLLEKHVTLARAEGGVDSAFSLEPDELAALVRESAAARAALGTGRVGPKEAEAEVLRFR